MRELVWTMTVICLAGSAWAADAPAGNRLTPEEAAQGWLLMFDGNALAHWRIYGESTIENDCLVLGGTRAAEAHPLIDFGKGFELRLEYQVQGTAPVFVMSGKPRSSYGGSGISPTAGTDWHALRLVGAMRADGWNFVYDIRRFGNETVLQTGGNPNVNQPRSDLLWFQVSPGSKLIIRTAKFTGTPVAGETSAWLLIFGMFLAMLLVVGLTTLVLYRVVIKRREMTYAHSPR